jgi:hypothetical protein
MSSKHPNNPTEEQKKIYQMIYKIKYNEIIHLAMVLTLLTRELIVMLIVNFTKRKKNEVFLSVYLLLLSFDFFFFLFSLFFFTYIWTSLLLQTLFLILLRNSAKKGTSSVFQPTSLYRSKEIFFKELI